MNRTEKIIAIVPALNESGKIGLVVSRIKREAASWIDEILVIDDGSEDNTGLEAQSNGAGVISHQKNRGAGAAIRTGIEYALKNNFDIVVILGGDNQDTPGQINRLLSPVLYNSFDFVQGSRYMAGGASVNMPLFRLLATRFYTFLFKFLLGFPVSDGTNGFRAFRLSIFNNKDLNIWQGWLDRYELEPYIFYKVINCRFKVTEAPVTKSYPSNGIGYTKMVYLFGWWSILRPIILLKLGLKR